MMPSRGKKVRISEGVTLYVLEKKGQPRSLSKELSRGSDGRVRSPMTERNLLYTSQHYDEWKALRS